MLGIQRWMASVSGEGWYWFVKYLSGNDTLLNMTHQAGPYIPKQVIRFLFPSIDIPQAQNPRTEFQASIDPHQVAATPRAIWYNNKLRGGSRDECRITNWGGRSSPLLNPEATGSLCIFAFHKVGDRDAGLCRIWLCGTIEEEEAAQSLVGPVDPGVGTFHDATGRAAKLLELVERDAPCRLSREQLPPEWLFTFPDAATIVRWSVARVPSARREPPDRRLVRRRDCEYDVFRSIEDIVVMPRVEEGFATVDLFVDFANAVTNRRKARSGASLELQAKTIFDEEDLPYAHDEVSEERKRPDFLFPSIEAYRDPSWPADKLQMLGVKTTCKDRWRQVINEADRIPKKYLLTLQEGVTPNQFQEMATEGVSLVVPSSLHSRYHPQIRPELLSLEKFIAITKEKIGS